MATNNTEQLLNQINTTIKTTLASIKKGTKIQLTSISLNDADDYLTVKSIERNDSDQIKVNITKGNLHKIKQSVSFDMIAFRIQCKIIDYINRNKVVNLKPLPSEIIINIIKK